MAFSLYPQSGRPNHHQNEKRHDSISIKWPSNTRPLSIPSKSTITIQITTRQPTQEELEAMSFRNLDKSKRQIWILAISWVLQALVIVSSIVAAIIATINLKRDTTTGDFATKDNLTYTVSFALLVLVFSFMAIYILLTLIEMIQFARNTLGPMYYTISNFLKGTGCILVLIVGLSLNAFGTIDIIVWTCASICFICPMTYGAVLLHKQRAMRRAIYDRAATKDNTEYVGSFGSNLPYDGISHVRNPSTNQAIRYDEASRSGWVDVEAVPEQEVPRRVSYNHKKDTRFDSYRQSLLPGDDPRESNRRADSV